ncbi:MAG: DNA primase [Clostridia bacterium]|nr:DNA primase [Clostridia bacterium]
MSRIPEDVVSQVLDKADIESVVGRYVSFTKRSGTNLYGLCPFHSEKTPSFAVNPVKGIYHCFGCNKGGNSIGFYMEMEKCSFPEAVRALAKDYGIEIPEYEEDTQAKKAKERKERIFALLLDSARFFYSCFVSDNGKVARDYAAQRNLHPNTCKAFGIGYAPDSWDSLYKELSSKGYTDDEMLNSGLFAQTKKKDRLVDLFRGRLMFPIFDAMGRIVAFGGRAMNGEMPKYINSPDSEVYKKQEHLYAFNFARKERPTQLIIVEGYMDAIAMHQAGIKNAVASLGTAFTDSQLRLAARYCEEVVFFFDADKAGQNAALRAIKMMLNYLKKLSGMKIRIKIACVPDAKDPDEYIKEFGVESFNAVVKSAKDVDDYLSDRAYNDCFIDDQLDLNMYQDKIIEFGSWITDEIKRYRFASKANIYLKAPPEVLVKRMEDIASQNDKRESIQVERNIVRENTEEISRRQETTSEVKEASNARKSAIPDDYASELELEVFAYAVQLNKYMVDPEYIKKIDIIRPNDFFGNNMKSIVEFYLDSFVEGRGVSEALLVGELQKYTLNNEQAEIAYLKAVEKLPIGMNINKLCIEYLVRLYRLRKELLRYKRDYLLKILDRTKDEEKRAVFIEKLRKIESGLEFIRKQEEKL